MEWNETTNKTKTWNQFQYYLPSNLQTWSTQNSPIKIDVYLKNTRFRFPREATIIVRSNNRKREHTNIEWLYDTSWHEQIQQNRTQLSVRQQILNDSSMLVSCLLLLIHSIHQFTEVFCCCDKFCQWNSQQAIKQMALKWRWIGGWASCEQVTWNKTKNRKAQKQWAMTNQWK